MKCLRKFFTNANKTEYLYLTAIIFCICSTVLGISLGSVRLSFTEIFDGIGKQIFLFVRLPRALACLIAGSALAVSGVITQGIFSNKLASPGIIGVNSGAGLAITVCTALGCYGATATAASSFIGAFIAVAVIAAGASKWGRSRSTVILMGIAINSLLNAVTSAIITLDPDVGVLSNDFKIGDFSSVTYDQIIPASIFVIAGFTVVLTLSNELDILGLGEDTALGLGLNTRLIRTVFLLIAAALAGAAVSLAGLLSFVGLIVPNAVRRLSGNSSKRILLLSALFGGGFTVLCDTVARTLFSPYEIPVGIIMSFIGAPFFIFLLINRKGGGYND